MQHLLIPTDFSPAADCALAYGQALASAYGAKVTLAYIHSMPMDPMRIGAPSADLYQDGEVMLERLAAELRAGGLEVATEVQLGTPVARLKSIIHKQGIDLVVMGCQGRHYVPTQLFGSTTTALMDEVRTPILAVPLAYEPALPRRIVWAVDGKVPSGTAGLEPLLELAERSDQELQVFHYRQEDEPALPAAKFKELLADVPYDIYVRMDEGETVERAIRDFVDKLGADLVALIHRRSGWLNRLVVASATRRTVLTSPVPVLILQAR